VPASVGGILLVEDGVFGVVGGGGDGAGEPRMSAASMLSSALSFEDADAQAVRRTGCVQLASSYRCLRTPDNTVTGTLRGGGGDGTVASSSCVACAELCGAAVSSMRGRLVCCSWGRWGVLGGVRAGWGREQGPAVLSCGSAGRDLQADS
jgi:hypothetical protein